jgi:hypothetical protein
VEKRIIWRIRASLILVAFLFLALFFIVPNGFDRFPLPANESSAVGSLRTLYSANIAYAKKYPQLGYPTKLTDLSRRSENPDHRNDPEWAIDSLLAGGEKTGYRFSYIPHSSKGDGRMDVYQILADPLAPRKSGIRHFFMDETGVIRASETDPASATSPALR